MTKVKKEEIKKSTEQDINSKIADTKDEYGGLNLKFIENQNGIQLILDEKTPTKRKTTKMKILSIFKNKGKSAEKRKREQMNTNNRNDRMDEDELKLEYIVSTQLDTQCSEDIMQTNKDEPSKISLSSTIYSVDKHSMK